MNKDFLDLITNLITLSFRWNCKKDLSVSGPVVLSMTMPSGFILDNTQKKELIYSGFNVWTEDNEIIFFFEKVKNII